MLMVTTTVNVINRIHSHTTSAWPRVPLDTVFVESPSCLQDGLVDTSTTSNNTNHSSSRAGHNLLST